MSRILTLVTAVFIAVSATCASAQEKIRIVGNFPHDHPSSQAMLLFKSELERLTKGKLTVDIFDAMQLGGAKENVDAVRAGTVFATWVGMAYLSRTIPALEAMSLPFLFRSREAAFRMIDGPIGGLLTEKLDEKGLVALGYMELGFRHVTNSKRPITRLADFQGLKIRLQPNETHLATFRALGANAVALDAKELYSALQQGVVDGQENPYVDILTSRYYEPQKFITGTGHFFDFIVVMANKSRFNALSEEFRTAIRTAMHAAVMQERRAAAERDAKALEELKARGLEYSALTPEALSELREAASVVVDSLRKRLGGDLIDRILSAAKE